MHKNNLMFLRRLHGRIHEEIYRFKMKKVLKERYVKPYLDKTTNGKKCVFLVLTPEHTNLGDHAIAKAEIELLTKNNYDYVEITGKQLIELQRLRLLKLLNKRPIIINGGGNLGTLWFGVEQLMRDIISENRKSPIFIYPNTVYYEDSAWGNQELANSVKIYNSHRNLHIYAREKYSYEYLLHRYRNVKIIPDMVLSQNECSISPVREGCLLCLRNDCEKTITDREFLSLTKRINALFGENVHLVDTHSAKSISPEERNEALQLKYDEFRTAKLVVTDRLHGMIFCAITGTPCIVINSKSPKVLGCYEWVKDLGYIRFCDNVDEIDKIYKSMSFTNNLFDNMKYREYYQILIDDLNKYAL